MANNAVYPLTPEETVLIGYHALAREVTVALRTQVGQTAVLEGIRDDVLRFVASSELHRDVFDPVEYGRLEHNTAKMISLLDEACHRSRDPPPRQFLNVSQRTSAGRRGRPRVHIDPRFLSQALELRSGTDVARLVGCHPRTVRRLALEHGIRSPGRPVMERVELANGTAAILHHSSTRLVSNLTDGQLDARILSILQQFPRFGRKMIQGALRDQGHQVPLARVSASFLRVHGPSAAFGGRAVHRRVYSVAGANALWHHDGQHGLIRFKIVIHGFIDGHSHLITGMGAHNNNRAATVAQLFDSAVRRYGLPRRVRGDHGGENVLVAERMERERGPNRGSYIWGRSVHNIRIERLWYDVTQGFGRKWKEFFHELEIHHQLDALSPEHIWLLHHLFLDAINADVQAWVAGWNEHTMELKGRRNSTPFAQFFFSMVQDGPRGVDAIDLANEQFVEPPDEHVEDIQAYGVDWELVDNPRFMDHFLANNEAEPEQENQNLFDGRPRRLHQVPCEPPGCPFPEELVAELDESLAERVDTQSTHMAARRLVWVAALELFNEMYAEL